MKVIRVEGQNWPVESVQEDGKKLVVTVTGGQKIICGGATAETVRKAFKDDAPADPVKVDAKQGSSFLKKK